MGGVILILNLLSVTVLDYHIMGKDLPFVLLVGPCVYWMMFYYLGVRYAINRPYVNITYLIVFAFFAFILQFVESYFIGPGIKATTWIWAYTAVMALLSEQAKGLYTKNEKNLRPLVFLGRYSFGIYLAHVYVLMLFGRLGIQCHWILMLIIVVALTTFCVWGACKVLPNRVIKYLGLK